MRKLSLAGCLLVAIPIGFIVGWGMFLDLSFILMLPPILLGLILVDLNLWNERRGKE